MEYYISENGQRVGPIQEAELSAHGVTVNTLVWCAGMETWKPAGQIPALAYLFGAQQSQPQPPVQPVYPQAQPQYAPGQQQAPSQPKNWLVESILVTLFCCLPFGIVGIIKASNVNTLYAAGNYDLAEQASQDAGKWTKIGFFVGLAVDAIYMIVMVILAMTGNSSF